MINIKEAFEKFSGSDYLKFDRVENKISKRPDLCAMLYLENLVEGKQRDMISAARHHEIWLDVDCDKLSEVATEDDILYLTRCGVRYCPESESLAFFV